MLSQTNLVSLWTRSDQIKTAVYSFKVSRKFSTQSARQLPILSVGLYNSAIMHCTYINVMPPPSTPPPPHGTSEDNVGDLTS